MSSMIAVGASLGGLAALQVLLRALPAKLGCPVALVQHRRADPDSQLATLLSHHSALPVCEPEDKTPIEADRVYLAPSDYHMLVDRDQFALSVDPPVHFARPSIDVLLESVADAYGAAAIAVMLTSSNEDGARGALSVKRAGGKVLVQDPTQAESAVGPMAVLARTKVDGVFRVEQLGAVLAELVGRAR
jgi:two-component system, chemotaxis family, protein-glutamate methylesterase/glutaminase